MIEDFNRALATIEERLAGHGGPHGDTSEVDVDALAREALTSTYHFRRMFSSLAGMGLSTYVRRRHMTLAAAEVQAGRSLLEVAVRYGYGSTEAFGRAFAAVHGVTTAAARRGGVELVTQPRLSFRLTVEGGSSMRHRIVDKPAFVIAGRHTTITLQYEGVRRPATERFSSWRSMRRRGRLPPHGRWGETRGPAVDRGAGSLRRQRARVRP